MILTKEIAMYVLSLKEGFTSKDLKNRYRTLSKISHPDTNGDNDLFLLVKACYEYLSTTASERKPEQNSNTQKKYRNYYQEHIHRFNVSLSDLYEKFYFYKNLPENYIIENIVQAIKISIKPFFSICNYSEYTMIQTASFKDFFSTKTVDFKTPFVLPESIKKHNVFTVEIKILGAVSKRIIFLDELNNHKTKLSLKYKPLFCFKTLIKLNFSK